MDERIVLRLYREDHLLRQFRLGDIAPAERRTSPHCEQTPLEGIGFSPDFKQLQIITCDGEAVLLDPTEGTVTRRVRLVVLPRRFQDGRQQIRPTDAFDRPHGEWVSLDPKGRVLQQASYTFGSATRWKRYTYDGDSRKPACQMTWDDRGTPIDTWTCQNTEGRTTEQRHYENGKAVEIVRWRER